MRCISPIMPKKGQWVPCGSCNFCLANKRADWSFRIGEEFRASTSAHFLTFTYDDKNVPCVLPGGEILRGRQCPVYEFAGPMPTLVKTDVQLFMKKLRKYEGGKIAGNRILPIRYYTIGEYGEETARPHYHSIMFNVQMSTIEELPKIWGYGNVHRGEVTAASIHYTTGYVITRVAFKALGRQRPFSLISNRSGGLGKSYLRAAKYHRRNQRTYVQSADSIQRLPRYYRDKIFTSRTERDLISARAEREALVLELAELERLEKIHTDPIRYMEERTRFNHELLCQSLIKTHKL